jgi:Spy/CpxP family protein refolding chaperone
MRSLHRLLAISILSLPLIAAMPAGAHDHDADDQDQDGNSQGNSQGGSAPEIDPGLLGGAVTLLAGGLLILRERRRA